jgi:microcystin-dependent protein
MAQITYENKVKINDNPSIPNVNKFTDDDMNEIKEKVNINTPIGAVSIFAGTVVPEGWLICDGSEISRSTYSNLFNVIGTTYGAGDGSTTFNLPDMRHAVPVGVDNRDSDFDTIGKTGGEKTHTLTINETPSHNHQFKFSYEVNAPAAGSGQIYFGTERNYNTGSNSNKTEATGDGQAHNNMQPYIVMNYIISY